MENPSFSSARGGSDPLLGELIDGRYRIERVLGTGGTGTVYLAEHVMMEKRVALKVLHATHAVISSAMDRFQREAIALARIEHPNVVSATDFGKLKNGAYYLALEYVEGASLGDVIAQEGVLEKGRALAIAYQIASALQAAHSQSIVHRDLKPHNVMLTLGANGTEVVKVLDFGLAKLRSKANQGSIAMSAGQVFGTPHYMAPEQISGDGVDHRVDLYALGVILYEMLSGVRPFDAKDVREILALQATANPAPLPDTVPSSLAQLVTRLMAKTKEERPGAAQEVLVALEPMLLRPSGGIRGFLTRPLKLGQWTLPLWILAAPGATFLLLFVFGLMQGPKEQPLSPPGAETGIVAKVEPTPPTAALPVPDPTPALIADAEFGEETAIVELSKTPPAQRDKALWLVLAKGRLKQRKADLAVGLLREAVSVQPELAKDEDIAALLRTAAGDPSAAKLALATAAEALGARGVDILFSVWSETKQRTPTTALAEQYLARPDVRKHASPALSVALSLRDELDCEAARRQVEQAKEVGDTRALRPLANLRKQKGCGAGKRGDCYPCLRSDELLETAISAAADRPGPRY